MADQGQKQRQLTDQEQWERIRAANAEELYWRTRNEWEIKHEMERRLERYFKRKRQEKNREKTAS